MAEIRFKATVGGGSFFNDDYQEVSIEAEITDENELRLSCVRSGHGVDADEDADIVIEIGLLDIQQVIETLRGLTLVKSDESQVSCSPTEPSRHILESAMQQQHPNT